MSIYIIPMAEVDLKDEGKIDICQLLEITTYKKGVNDFWDILWMWKDDKNEIQYLNNKTISI